MIEDPLPRQVAWRDSLVERIVYIPADCVWLPLDGKDVPVISERTVGQHMGARDAVRPGIARSVHGAVHRARLPADVLHDVDLAAPRPPNPGTVVPQQPECGPHTLPSRDVNTRLDAAVPPRPSGCGTRLQPSGRVGTAAGLLATSFDDQLAGFDAHVVAPVGIELELGVPPAITADLRRPVRRVEARAVELVAPHEPPTGR